LKPDWLGFRGDASLQSLVILPVSFGRVRIRRAAGPVAAFPHPVPLDSSLPLTDAFRCYTSASLNVEFSQVWQQKIRPARIDMIEDQEEGFMDFDDEKTPDDEMEELGDELSSDYEEEESIEEGVETGMAESYEAEETIEPAAPEQAPAAPPAPAIAPPAAARPRPAPPRAAKKAAPRAKKPAAKKAAKKVLKPKRAPKAKKAKAVKKSAPKKKARRR
jgi:hypothetical protein